MLPFIDWRELLRFFCWIPPEDFLEPDGGDVPVP